MSRSKSRQKTWMPITNHDVTLVSFAFVNAFRITFWDHQHIKLCIMRHLIANFIWQKRTYLTTFWSRNWWNLKYLGNIVNVAFRIFIQAMRFYVAVSRRKSQERACMPLKNWDDQIVSSIFFNAFCKTFLDHQHIKLC